MRRTIVTNGIEPAPLSLRHPAGLGFNLDLTVFEQNGALLDLAFASPYLELEPRSGGPAQGYTGVFDTTALGTATFSIPGGDYTDPNGYRVSLYGSLEGAKDLVARGVGSVTPTSGSTAVTGEPPPVVQKGYFDLNIIRADSWTWQFTLYGDTARTIPSDLTGTIIAAQIRDAVGGTVLTTMPCVIQGDPVDGVVWMSIASEQSVALPPRAYWDMQISYPDGDIKTPIQGRVIVTEDITRPP